MQKCKWHSNSHLQILQNNKQNQWNCIKLKPTHHQNQLSLAIPLGMMVKHSTYWQGSHPVQNEAQNGTYCHTALHLHRWLSIHYPGHTSAVRQVNAYQFPLKMISLIYWLLARYYPHKTFTMIVLNILILWVVNVTEKKDALTNLLYKSASIIDGKRMGQIT